MNDTKRHSTARAALGVVGFLLLLPGVALAQSTVGEWWSTAVHKLQGPSLAIAVLFGGWLVAKLLGYVTFAVLSRTEVDNKIADALGINLLLEGKDKKKVDGAVERFAARIVFWLVMLLAVVAALDFAGLTAAAGPIENFVDTMVQALPLIGKAVLILVVAYFAGLILRKVVTLGLGRAKLDAKLAEAGGVGAEQKPFSETAGAAIFWLVMLVGLAGAFEALKIEAVAAPMRNMLGTVVQLLPALAVSALILLAGYVLGRLARTVLQNLLHSFGFDALPARVGLEKVFEKRAPSDVVGLVAMTFILIHAFIAAFDELGLAALSAPLRSAVDQFWALLPSLMVAALIVAAGVIAGRVVRSVAAGMLAGVGFDRWLERLGLDMGKFAKEGEAATTRRVDKPSELLGFIAQLAVVLVALVQALQTLQLAVWAGMVQTFLSYTILKVLVALAIVGTGFAIGNYVRDLIRAKGGDDDTTASWLGSAARITVLVFAFTMGFQQLEVAPDFVRLTFGLVFGALCLALALGFGLGSREVAGDIVKKQYNKTSTPKVRPNPLIKN